MKILERLLFNVYLTLIHVDYLLLLFHQEHKQKSIYLNIFWNFFIIHILCSYIISILVQYLRIRETSVLQAPRFTECTEWNSVSCYFMTAASAGKDHKTVALKVFRCRKRPCWIGFIKVQTLPLRFHHNFIEPLILHCSPRSTF